MCRNETTLLVQYAAELVPRIDARNHRIAEVQRLLEDTLLDLVQQRYDVLNDTLLRHCALFERIAASDLDRAVCDIAATHCQTHRHALQLILGKLEARTHVVAVVDLDAHALSLQSLGNRTQLLDYVLQLLLALVDRHHNNLNRSQFRRQHQTVIIRVSHNQRTHQTGRNAPRRCPNIL